MRIPIERHPYADVEKAVRMVSKDLALVRSSRHHRTGQPVWVVAQEAKTYVPTHPSLLGVPGSAWPFGKWVWVFSLMDGEKRSVTPSSCRFRLIRALREMDTSRHGGFCEAIDAMEKSNAGIRQKSIDGAKDIGMDIARDIWNSKGRIISTPYGTSNVDKVRQRSIPIRQDGVSRMVDIDKCPPNA